MRSPTHLATLVGHPKEGLGPSATFHIMTPYPSTGLWHQLDREGRILHRDWDLYDVRHVVRARSSARICR